MPISELNPVFEIKGKRYVMITQAIGSVSGSDLKCAVMFLAGHYNVIKRALDRLLEE